MNLLPDPLSHLTAVNPLRGLDHAGLIRRMEAGERGDYSLLQWTYRFVERRNATARAIKKKLSGALRSLDWQIKTRDDVPEARQAEAAQQEAVLRAAYERITNLKRALVHLALADFRGYAHCCKVYRGPTAPAAPGAGMQGSLPVQQSNSPTVPGPSAAWDVIELRTVPQWHFSRRGYDTGWTYDPRAKFGIAVGTPILDRDWIAHETEDPASEIFAGCHVQQYTTDLDWDGFMELYGIPAIFIEGPPNVPKVREAEYQKVAEGIIGDGRGYLPNGSKVHSVDPPQGVSKNFEDRLGWLQRLMVLAGTGGVLTMLAEPTGLGKGASDAHDDTWMTIAAGVAADVTETMQAQFDKPELMRAFGPDVEPLVYFEIAKPDKEDVNGLSATVLNFRQAGYEADAQELTERAGITLTKAAMPAAPGSPGQPQNIPPPHDTGGAADALPSPPQPGSPKAEASTMATPPGTDQSPAATGGAAAHPPQSNSPSVQQSTAAPAPTGEPAAAAIPTSASGSPKPALLTAAISDATNVAPETFAPVKPWLDHLAELIGSSAPAEEIVAAMENLVAAMPALLGQLDDGPLAAAMEKAFGAAAVQGVHDAIAARRK